MFRSRIVFSLVLLLLISCDVKVHLVCEAKSVPAWLNRRCPNDGWCSRVSRQKGVGFIRFCLGQRCHECRNDGDCPPARRRCDFSRGNPARCVACLADADCVSPKKFCDPSPNGHFSTCLECRGDADCTAPMTCSHAVYPFMCVPPPPSSMSPKVDEVADPVVDGADHNGDDESTVGNANRSTITITETLSELVFEEVEDQEQAAGQDATSNGGPAKTVRSNIMDHNGGGDVSFTKEWVLGSHLQMPSSLPIVVTALEDAAQMPQTSVTLEAVGNQQIRTPGANDVVEPFREPVLTQTHPLDKKMDEGEDGGSSSSSSTSAFAVPALEELFSSQEDILGPAEAVLASMEPIPEFPLPPSENDKQQPPKNEPVMTQTVESAVTAIPTAVLVLSSPALPESAVP